MQWTRQRANSRRTLGGTQTAVCATTPACSGRIRGQDTASRSPQGIRSG